MHPVRCTCGSSFMAPPGVAGVVCPYCRQPLVVPAVSPAGPASEARRTWAAILLAGAIVAVLARGPSRD